MLYVLICSPRLVLSFSVVSRCFCCWCRRRPDSSKMIRRSAAARKAEFVVVLTLGSLLFDSSLGSLGLVARNFLRWNWPTRNLRGTCGLTFFNAAVLELRSSKSVSQTFFGLVVLFAIMTAVTPGRIVRRWLRLEIGSTRDIDQSATRQKSKKVFSPTVQ